MPLLLLAIGATFLLNIFTDHHVSVVQSNESYPQSTPESTDSPYTPPTTQTATPGSGGTTVATTVTATTQVTATTPVSSPSPTNAAVVTPTVLPATNTVVSPTALTPNATPIIDTPAPATPEGAVVTATASTQLNCLPGEPVEIQGTGPANIGVLLLFANRAVSGGTIGSDGRFILTLVIGREAPGIYPVVVQDRNSREALLTLSCEVPTIQPTVRR
jgi:hypothetical protein